MSEKKSKIGVITEQGFPMGELGFNPLSEQDEAKIKKTDSEETTHKNIDK